MPRLPSFDAKIAEQLEEHEGFIPYAYRDSKGYWTIGIGHLIDSRRGGGISRDIAEVILGDDLQKFEEQLDKALPWWRELSDIRQRVILDMVFQMGLGRAPFTQGEDDPGEGLLSFVNTLGHIRGGRWKQAASGMLASKWARVDSPNRARRLAKMMETNEEVKKDW